MLSTCVDSIHVMGNIVPVTPPFWTNKKQVIYTAPKQIEYTACIENA